jgi:hypothetical protein
MRLSSQATIDSWGRIALSLEAALTDSMQVDQTLSKTQATFGTIKGAFDRVCGYVKPTPELARRVISFQIGFVNKKEDHIAFFGGVLTGVHVVRFTPQDMQEFFSDVVQINESALEDELHDLPMVVATRKVSGDVFNHTCLWLTYLFLSSNLPDVLKQRAAQAAALILQYRYLTSLLYNYYKFPANPEVAAAAYARLTKKSAIKQFGSWHALLENRVEDLVTVKGLHYSRIMIDYRDDKAIVNALNDSQGRIREMMKNLMSELKKTSDAGIKTRSISSVAEFDGESFLRDKTKDLSSYTRYLHNIITDEHAFIKQELLMVLAEAMYTTPPALIEQTLKWCCHNSRTVKGKELDDLIEMVVVHSFGYLQDNRTATRETNDLVGFITRLRGVYTSARSTDHHLLSIRALAEKIVVKALTIKNPSTIASVRTSLMLYLVIRAFTMGYYADR